MVHITVMYAAEGAGGGGGGGGVFGGPLAFAPMPEGGKQVTEQSQKVEPTVRLKFLETWIWSDI